MVPLNVPNALTVVRILLVPVLVVALLEKTGDGDLLAAIVFAVASMTDAIDGYLARSRNWVTTFGKLMDPIADKLLIIAALVALVSLSRLQAWVAMVIIAREFAVTVLRVAVGTQQGLVIAANRLGKLKTALQVVMVMVLIIAVHHGRTPAWVDAIVYVTVLVTVLSGAGDSGAAGYEANGSSFYSYPVTGWPASDPLVTAVGGTRLNLDSSGKRTSADTVWNDTYSKTANQLINGNNGPNPLAGGGGTSVVFSRPAYQNTVSGVVGSHRGVPDISMSAACSGAVNIYQSFAGQTAGWYALCGTSEATPLFAGIVALADQLAGHSLGLINPALYRLSAEHAPGIVDVTSGNNTVSFSQGGQEHTVRGFAARQGYDLASGVGTVNAEYLVPELAGR